MMPDPGIRPTIGRRGVRELRRPGGQGSRTRHGTPGDVQGCLASCTRLDRLLCNTANRALGTGPGSRHAQATGALRIELTRGVRVAPGADAGRHAGAEPAAALVGRVPVPHTDHGPRGRAAGAGDRVASLPDGTWGAARVATELRGAGSGAVAGRPVGTGPTDADPTIAAAPIGTALLAHTLRHARCCRARRA